MTVSAVIPSLPARRRMLDDALASVEAQDRPVDHLSVAFDINRDGAAATRNRAAMGCTSEWLAFLDDDDVWYPNHISTLVHHAEGADVIYPDCRVVGRHSLVCNIDFDAATLAEFNFIPITVLIRREAFMDAGMFYPHDRFEDWELWKRLHDAGATFRHVPVTTWEYRFHGAQRTFEPA